MKRIKKNKKGFSAFIVQPFIFAIFVLIVIFFLILISYNKKAIEDDIKEQQIASDGRTLMLNFLRLPATVNGEQMTNAELIRLYCYETVLTKDGDGNRYVQPLKKEVFSYFNKIYGENTKSSTDEWWEFEIIFLRDPGDTDKALTLMNKKDNLYHYTHYPNNRDANINKGSQVVSLNDRMIDFVTIPSLDGGIIEVRTVAPETPYIYLEG